VKVEIEKKKERRKFHEKNSLKKKKTSF